MCRLDFFSSKEKRGNSRSLWNRVAEKKGAGGD
jgi:hypothetical protein